MMMSHNYLSKGLFREEKLISGSKVRVCKAVLSRQNFLNLEFSNFRKDDEVFSFKESTSTEISEHPLRPDVYECKTVSCKKSRWIK